MSSFFLAIKKSKIGLNWLIWMLCVQLLLAPLFPGTAASFGKFGLSDEMELGRKFSIMIKSRLPLVEDPEIKGYIEEITQRLIKTAPPQPYKFDVNVLRSDSINAFCSPGGHLFVFTGLILSMNNESELAGVMAHELAHATQRHIATRIERSQIIGLASTLLALGGMFMGGDARGATMAGALAGGQTAMLNYSRQDETEADQIGLNYLIGAGYSPEGLPDAFEVIRRDQRLTSSGIPTYMSTHPDVVSRISDMSARIQGMGDKVKNRKEDNAKFIRIQTLVRAKYSDPNQALRFFELDKKNPAYLNVLGKAILYARLNKVAEASKAFDEAIKIGSHEPLVWREAGIFQYRKGGGANSSQKAAEYLGKAVQMKRDDYLARFYNALILGETGNFLGAQEQFKEVLRYLPEDDEVHFAYGRLLGQAGYNFDAYLHLAYSSLYSNNKQQTKANKEKAESFAKTPAQQLELEKFEAKYKEREEFW